MLRTTCERLPKIEEVPATLYQGNTYHDRSTVVVTPVRGKTVPLRTALCWMNLAAPPNTKCSRMVVTGDEVATAYNNAVVQILANPTMSKMKYLLTWEDDNLPPPDGLLKLLAAMETSDFDVVGGLYREKRSRIPICCGRPGTGGFEPFEPAPDGLTACNGLGMGFTLFKLDLFRSETLPFPWFMTRQTVATQEQEGGIMTHDLYFFDRAGQLGHTFAVDGRVVVGHLDTETDTVY